MKSKNYSLDAGLVLNEIDTHPETANRILELLCPLKEYAHLKLLFNYDDLIRHVKNYIRDGDDNSKDLDHAQNLLEKDLRILKNNLSEFLGKEREIKYWGRQINWNKNVNLSIPTRIVHEKRLDNDTEQKAHSLEDESSTVILDDGNDILKVILLVQDNGNKMKNQQHFNKCLFRIELEPKQNIVEKKIRIILLDRFSKVDFSSTKSNQNEYWARRILRGIPLHIEDRGNGLCIYSVTQISAVSSKVSRWYLHAYLNENGRKKIEITERLIRKIQSSTSTGSEVNTEKLKRYQQKRDRITNKRQYQILTVKIKGLLLYSLLESDEHVFNEILHNLSKYNKYDETYFGLHYDKEDEFRNLSNEDQTEKMDFPFLLDYHEFSDVLPQGFVFTVFKGIASDLKDKLETTSASKLKFEVTIRFLKAIRDHLWTLQLGDRPIDWVDDAKFRILCNYHTVIGSYVRRKQDMLAKADDFEWTEEIKFNRYRLLERRFLSLMRNNDEVANPIISVVAERNEESHYTDLLDVLKTLERAYGDKYVICESCFIAKWKANELRSLLLSLKGLHHQDVTLEHACQSLTMEGGLPKSCIDTNQSDMQDVLNKLGFRIRTERANGSSSYYIVDCGGETFRLDC